MAARASRSSETASAESPRASSGSSGSGRYSGKSGSYVPSPDSSVVLTPSPDLSSTRSSVPSSAGPTGSFTYESPDLGAGLLWGTVYGLVRWLVGALTLLPVLSGAPVGWTAEAVATAFRLLIAHVIYDALTGVAFTLLERHRAAWATVDSRTAEREQRRRRPFTIAAPSVWLFVIGTTVIVPATLL